MLFYANQVGTYNPIPMDDGVKELRLNVGKQAIRLYFISRSYKVLVIGWSTTFRNCCCSFRTSSFYIFQIYIQAGILPPPPLHPYLQSAVPRKAEEGEDAPVEGDSK